MDSSHGTLNLGLFDPYNFMKVYGCQDLPYKRDKQAVPLSYLEVNTHAQHDIACALVSDEVYMMITQKDILKDSWSCSSGSTWQVLQVGCLQRAFVLQSHPFFNGVDWDNLYSTQAPHQPTVKHPLDTQNFENFDEQAPAGLNPSGMKRWARADPNFVGYTYKNWEAVQPGAHDGKSFPLSCNVPCCFVMSILIL